MTGAIHALGPVTNFALQPAQQAGHAFSNNGGRLVLQGFSAVKLFLGSSIDFNLILSSSDDFKILDGFNNFRLKTSCKPLSATNSAKFLTVGH